MSEVSATLLDFVAYWVQTHSDYDTLIAKAMKSDWAEDHMPVLSRRHHDPKRYTTFFKDKLAVAIEPSSCQDDHILYTKFSLGNPAGGYIKCPKGCQQKLKSKQAQLGVRISCPVCGARCTIPTFRTDRATTLTRHAFVAVKYPPKQYPVTWELVKKAEPEPMLDTPPDTTPVPSLPPFPPPSHSHLSAPAMMVRSTSLPSADLATPGTSSSTRIYIPRLASTPSLRPATTPSPPSPPSPQGPPKQAKRTVEELRTNVWQVKRQRRDKA